MLPSFNFIHDGTAASGLKFKKCCQWNLPLRCICFNFWFTTPTSRPWNPPPPGYFIYQNEFLIHSVFHLLCINCACCGICTHVGSGKTSLRSPASRAQIFFRLVFFFFPLKWGVQRSVVSRRRHRPNGRVMHSSLSKDAQLRTTY